MGWTSAYRGLKSMSFKALAWTIQAQAWVAVMGTAFEGCRGKGTAEHAEPQPVAKTCRHWPRLGRPHRTQDHPPSDEGGGAQYQGRMRQDHSLHLPGRLVRRQRVPHRHPG